MNNKNNNEYNSKYNKNNNKENKDSIRIVKIISEDGNSNNNVSGENTQNNMENYNSNEEVNNYNSPNPYNITNNSNQFHDVDMEAILDVMGCRTRREIINLLREEPRFVSEISQELEVGQKAIIEHLRAMEEIGILESSFRKIVRGRPRKYYDMPHDFAINITITENSFDVNISEDILNLKQLPSGDEWSKLLELERRIDQGHWEAVEELKSQIRLYDNLKSRAEYILERTQRR